MAIMVTPSKQAWIDTHAASGEFASSQDAARRLIAGAIIEQAALEADDLALAKPLVDEALAEIERGAFMTLEKHQARNKVRIAAKAQLTNGVVFARDRSGH